MNTEKLTADDIALIEAARETIRKNYDKVHFRHTVAAAVRCGDGKIYTGVNLYSLYGACAEMIAVGTAITAGERTFECLAAVRGEDGSELLPPCGNCRQFLADYMPACEIIVPTESGPQKCPAIDLLPLAYSVPE